MSDKTDILNGIEKQINQSSVVFFDLDGTLVDTDLANFKAYNEALKTVINFNSDLEFNPKQRINREVLRKRFPHLSDSQFERIVTEKETLFEKYLNDTFLNERVIELLKSCYLTNTTVLVTNCRKNRAIGILNYYELTHYFNHLFFRQFNKNGKHVNKYKDAIDNLSISPDSVVVIENERQEIEDAISAKILVNNILKFGK